MINNRAGEIYRTYSPREASVSAADNFPLNASALNKADKSALDFLNFSILEGLACACRADVRLQSSLLMHIVCSLA